MPPTPSEVSDIEEDVPVVLDASASFESKPILSGSNDKMLALFFLQEKEGNSKILLDAF